MKALFCFVGCMSWERFHDFHEFNGGKLGLKYNKMRLKKSLNNGGYYDTPHWVLCAL